MYYCASKNNVITPPNFQLCGAGLPYTDSYRYLGHIISSDLSDNVDIIRQTRCHSICYSKCHYSEI